MQKGLYQFGQSARFTQNRSILHLFNVRLLQLCAQHQNILIIAMHLFFVMKNTPILLLALLCFVLVSPNHSLCSVCKGTIKTVDFIVRHILPNKFAAQFVEILCMRKYDSKDLCDKVGEEIAPIGINSMIEKYLNPDHICSQLCGHNFKKYVADEQVLRILELDFRRSQVPNLQQFIERKQHKANLSSQQIHVLHLSDIHLDQHYTQNASIQCSYPICCHPEHGFPENPAAKAPYFGSKNCDCPVSLFSSMLQSLTNIEEKIDIVLATGDFSAHDEWEKNKESISENNKKIQESIKNSEKLHDSVFIRSEGNNDYSPDHQYDASKTKLISVITLQDQNQPSISMTFISINTIIYDNYNLYLLGDQSYAIFQLMILEQQLKTHTNIYLTGHIPPTLDQTAPQYSKVLRALIAKYQDKIVNQFYGHTHLDQLSINTYPGQTDKITSFSFIAPSLSPLGVGKSKYRLYSLEVGGEQKGVIDFKQYMMKDLNSKSGEWIHDYTFSEKYGLSGKKPITKQQISKIVTKILLKDGFSRQNYIRTTGVTKQNQFAPYHCLILDDPHQRNKCSKQANSGMSSKLFDLIDILRGQWNYNLSEAS